MECPRCGLLNPESERRCDCGYDFHTHTVQGPDFKEDEKRPFHDLKLALTAMLAVCAAMVVIVYFRPVIGPVSASFMLLEILLIAAMAANVGGIRSRTPFFNSRDPGIVLMAWFALLAVSLVALYFVMSAFTTIGNPLQ